MDCMFTLKTKLNLYILLMYQGYISNFVKLYKILLQCINMVSADCEV